MKNTKTTNFPKAAKAELKMFHIGESTSFAEFVASKAIKFSTFKKSDKRYAKLLAEFQKLKASLPKYEAVEKLAQKPERESRKIEPSLEKRQKELEEVDADLVALNSAIEFFTPAFKSAYNGFLEWQEESTNRDSNKVLEERLLECSQLVDAVFEEMKAHKVALIEGRKAVVRLISAHAPSRNAKLDKIVDDLAEESKAVKSPKDAKKVLDKSVKKAKALPKAEALPKAKALPKAEVKETIKEDDVFVLKAKAKKANEFIEIFSPDLKKAKQRIVDIQKATIKRDAMIRLSRNRSIVVSGNGFLTLSSQKDGKAFTKSFPVKQTAQLLSHLS